MSETRKAEKQIYLVVHRGVDGWIPSFDTGNPFITYRAARRAIAAQGPYKSLNYRIVKYIPAEPFRVTR